MEQGDKRTYWLRSDIVKRNAITFIEGLPVDKNKPIEVVIQPAKSQRSTAQNRLYWFWVGYISEAQNEPKDVVHLKLAFEFLPLTEFSKPVMIKGVQIGAYPMSTTDLNTKQFSDYLGKIEAKCMEEWGLILPQPMEYEYAKVGRA